MADRSGIEWTDATWNPTTGCDRVSPGCDHCYALTLAKRLKGMGSAKYQRDGDPRTSGPGFGITEHPDTLATPLGWRSPRKVFVNSMSDLFHAGVSAEHIARVWVVMAATPQHTYQVLTKRHGRMRSLLSSPDFQLLAGKAAFEFMQEHKRPVGWSWPLPNVWLGVSVEDQKHADLRIPALLDTPAAVRWISAEPLLGGVDLSPWLAPKVIACWAPGYRPDVKDAAALSEITRAATRHFAREGGKPEPAYVDWIVAGGESGPGARPMHPAWASSLRDQCQAAGVAFHFKQRGDWTWTAPPGNPEPRGFLSPDGEWSDTLPRVARLDRWSAMYRVGKHAAGRGLDGRTWDEYPDSAEARADAPARPGGTTGAS